MCVRVRTCSISCNESKSRLTTRPWRTYAYEAGQSKSPVRRIAMYVPSINVLRVARDRLTPFEDTVGRERQKVSLRGIGAEQNPLLRPAAPSWLPGSLKVGNQSLGAGARERAFFPAAWKRSKLASYAPEASRNASFHKCKAVVPARKCPSTTYVKRYPCNREVERAPYGVAYTYVVHLCRHGSA